VYDLIVANVSSQLQQVELDLTAYIGLVPHEMCREGKRPAIGTGAYELRLGPYACSWFRLSVAA
jgi:maltose alpha-D-glucosyltransferase/alpha-amylase